MNNPYVPMHAYAHAHNETDGSWLESPLFSCISRIVVDQGQCGVYTITLTKRETES